MRLVHCGPSLRSARRHVLSSRSGKLSLLHRTAHRVPRRLLLALRPTPRLLRPRHHLPGAQSVPKRTETALRNHAETSDMRGRSPCYEATSRHVAATPATSPKESGGLEVPSSNLGAPIKRKPRSGGVFFSVTAYSCWSEGIQGRPDTLVAARYPAIMREAGVFPHACPPLAKSADA